MNRTGSSRDTTALVVAGALLVLILALDAVTLLGFADWALYFVAIAATLFQSRPAAPLIVAGVATVFSAVGVVLSPPGIDMTIAVTNRCLSAIAHCTLGVVIWRVLHARHEMQRLLWLQESHTGVARSLQGEQSVESMGQSAVRALCEATGAVIGAAYRVDGDGLVLVGGHGVESAALSQRLPLDHGIAGTVVKTAVPKVVTDIPAGHLAMVSALGRSMPRHLLLGPLTADGQAFGLVELGFVRAGASLQREASLLSMCAEPVGMALRTTLYRQRLAELLEATQRQSEELQAQQEELRVTNEELDEQSRALQESQARLEQQQTELEQTNVQLEEQTQELERQRQNLERAQEGLRANADRLETASRYKSEFLANMSHELRTPLNSALILARLLADNKEETLTPEQVKYARAIHDANNDLLVLINDILDLSKIEAGHVELVFEPVPLREVIERLRDAFQPLTHQKGLAFAMQLAPDAPERIHADRHRLQQVLTNLLANAVKFTASGEVMLRVETAAGGRMRFIVQDTGIGIPRDRQAMIFEPFRQADGGTSRKYGGTGLGLSIARELTSRMGGDIVVDSEPGRGSRFTVELPVDMSRQQAPAPADASGAPAASIPFPEPAPGIPPPAPATVDDDRAHRRHPGRLILVVEDDAAFAQAVLRLLRERQFDGVLAGTAAEALQLARDLRPGGILLDIMLPDASGLTVLERLKRDPATRHIPVHIMSALDRSQPALELGAIGFLAKPATQEALLNAIGGIEQRLQRNMRRLLVVEDDAGLRENLKLLLADSMLEISAVGTMADALHALATTSFDCMVTDLALPDGSGYDLMERMAAMDGVAFPPVIVYTGQPLTRDQEQRLRRYSQSIIVKGARSPERLLDEVTLFLHSVESALPADQQRMLRRARSRDSVLDGRRLLLAEDDVRNIFALSSVFEPLGATLEVARNGKEAIELLRRGDIDLVLMDIMMPEMDGLTAIRLIRAEPPWSSLPIIALTAKAMPEDRERCLEAGANDYIAKPIDIDKLVSLCRVWCPK